MNPDLPPTAPPIRPIALTMGDACGIGPEILAMSFRQGAARGCFVVGSIEVMRRAAGIVGGWLPVLAIDQPQEALHAPPHCIPVLQTPDLPADLLQAPIGRVDRRAGVAAASAIRWATQLALDHKVAAIVTAPIHKEALSAAGEPYPGHTELLQALCGAADVRMMLANHELKTVLVSIHTSLRLAIEAVQYERVLQTILITDDSLKRMGYAQPRIAVAGLNPHAGEGGLFGDEELRIIGPAVQAARALGIQASGPWAGDTVFMRARHTPGHAGEFDVVIAMYHDQGLIPVKYLGVDEGVNVTLGLPLVRTSPDHGTAFDIAGSGRASPASLIEAIHVARQLSGQAH